MKERQKKKGEEDNEEVGKGRRKKAEAVLMAMHSDNSFKLYLSNATMVIVVKFQSLFSQGIKLKEI